MRILATTLLNSIYEKKTKTVLPITKVYLIHPYPKNYYPDICYAFVFESAKISTGIH